MRFCSGVAIVVIAMVGTDTIPQWSVGEFAGEVLCVICQQTENNDRGFLFSLLLAGQTKKYERVTSFVNILKSMTEELYGLFLLVGWTKKHNRAFSLKVLL